MSSPTPPSPFEKMTKEEIAACVGTWAQAGSQLHEKMLATLSARCASDIEKALKSLEESQNRNATTTDTLAVRVFWLNVVLTVATVIGTVIALLAFLHAP